MRNWPPPQRDSEPEIIPPGAEPRPRPGVWITQNGYGFRRVYVSGMGPLAFLKLGLLVGAASAVAILLLLGAVLLWLPVIGLIAAAALVAAFLRGPSRRLP